MTADIKHVFNVHKATISYQSGPKQDSGFCSGLGNYLKTNAVLYPLPENFQENPLKK